MNTNSLKRFAVTARNLLMQGVRNRLIALGFNEDGSSTATVEAVQNAAIHNGILINDNRFADRWNALRNRIASHGVKEVVEEAAYTWFNRLIAIRILEYNSLAPALLDFENPEIRIPRIVTDARAGKTPVLSDEDRASLEAVIGDGLLSFEQFAILIRAYCENNPIIRKCFGGITDYTVLLLPADILGHGNYLDLINAVDTCCEFKLQDKGYRDLNDIITEEDYRKPELIGWLYQFYISEKKDIVMKQNHYDKSDIPAATQIFTPNWIVKYMVENTLGRIYLDNNPDSALAESWKYLVEPTAPTPDDAILHYDSLEDLKCGDLSCGSGHILNEMFDLLYQLYAEDFYSPREAVEAILTKNMVGIDLDDRARQLAQFALLLKACQTDTAFADGHCMPRIYSMPEVKAANWPHIHGEIVKAYSIVAPSQDSFNQVEKALELMEDANVLGSIMKFDISEETRRYIASIVSEYTKSPRSIQLIDECQLDIPGGGPIQTYIIPNESRDVQYFNSFAPIVDAFRVILALTDKYAALCMNPPYMPTSKESKLKVYAFTNYPTTKADLFAIFMDVAMNCLKECGKYGMINMQSWMFLSSFESLRENIINNQQIDSLLHLGSRTFDELSGEVVQNAAFVISNERPNHSGIYYRLIDGNSCSEKRERFENKSECYIVKSQNEYKRIPGDEFCYWLPLPIVESFSNGIAVDKVADKAFQGIITDDNNLLLREWYEVNADTLRLDASSFNEDFSYKKWIPYNKGGSPRKWYGNLDYVVNFNNRGFNFTRGKAQYKDFFFKENISWDYICGPFMTARYYPSGCLWDVHGSPLFMKDAELKYVLSLINTPIGTLILKALNPTLACQVENILKLPILGNPVAVILDITNDCISISKQDWDAHETSWNFEESPLLAIQNHRRGMIVDVCFEPGEEYKFIPGVHGIFDEHLIEHCYNSFCDYWECLFDRLHRNEEEVNRKFIAIYGLQDELTPDVALEDVTILQQGEIKIVDEAALELETGGVLTTESGETLTVGIAPQIEWQRDVIIKQFISYAVSCMMGRYRLDRPGLAIAHSNPSPDEYAPYTVPQTGEQWWIDDDGIVPMMGEDCGFHDNASNRFTEFIRVVFGNESLTENMNFVRDALGKDVVDYLRTDFYADHKKMYQNRPIYWMFSSNQKGKRAAFQCLVYMHRMNRFTPEHIRTNYLLPYIDHLAAREAELSARSSLSAKENKLLKQLRSDLDECRDYQLRLHEFADRQIEIDLDDGVVKNYATFAPVLAKLK